MKEANAYIKERRSPSGLKWINVGTAKPEKGTPLVHNERLAEALKRHPTEFNKQEWEAFCITGLRLNHFIKSGDSYFKPDDVPLAGGLPKEHAYLTLDEVLAVRLYSGASYQVVLLTRALP